MAAPIAAVAGAYNNRNSTVNLTTVFATVNKLSENDITTFENTLLNETQRVARTDVRVAVNAFAAAAVVSAGQLRETIVKYLSVLAHQGTSPLATYANSAFYLWGSDPANGANVCRALSTFDALHALVVAALPHVTNRQVLRTYADLVYNTGKASNIVWQFGRLHGIYAPGIGFDCSEYISPNLLSRRELKQIRNLKKLAINQSIIDEDITALRELDDESHQEAERVTTVATTSTATRGHRKNISSLTLGD